MQPFQEFAELRELLDVLCEETITAAQMLRLEHLVLSHPEAEAFFVQYRSQYADLLRHFTERPGLTEEELRIRVAEKDRQITRPTGSATRRSLVPPLRLSRPRRFLLIGGVIGLAAALLLAAWLPRQSSSEPALTTPASAEQVDNSVAVLLHAPGAVWEESELPTRVGAPLPPGWLRLKSGFAHIEFYSGATVILEGPAEFQLLSPDEAYCARGKLRAMVPPQAQGFRIGSPSWDLVDRGTEFGLQVGAAGKAEVHVFQGRVDLYDAGADPKVAPHKELTMGHGMRADERGQLSPIESNSAAFLTARGLAARWDDEMRRRHERWLRASAALQKDPSLLVYYSFQRGNDSWSRTLPDQSRGPLQARDGAIIGCTWGTGRWPGKQGLEFKQVSDRVRFHVPGEFDALTLMTWARVDALPNRFNSLMMTEGWEDSAPHWHISQAGKIELGVQGPNGKGGVHYYSPQVFTPEKLGQWVHLAVVYDRNGEQVTHYVNGKPVSQEELKLDVPLHLGDVELGNWNVGARRHHHPIRYFTGCIDEFMLFARAASAQEVERFYTEGQPAL